MLMNVFVFLNLHNLLNCGSFNVDLSLLLYRENVAICVVNFFIKIFVYDNLNRVYIWCIDQSLPTTNLWDSYWVKAVECKLIFVSKTERIDGLTYILVYHLTADMFGEALTLTPLCSTLTVHGLLPFKGDSTLTTSRKGFRWFVIHKTMYFVGRFVVCNKRLFGPDQLLSLIYPDPHYRIYKCLIMFY